MEAQGEDPAKPFHIAIIGGGITGLVLALALKKRRIGCTIYERAPSFGEIGAGVAISVNAARALSLCDVTDEEIQAEGWFDPGSDEKAEDSGRSSKGMGPIYAALDRCATHNTFANHRDIWFDFLDGTSKTDAKELRPPFQLRDRSGFPQSCGVHRAKWLEEMVKLLPEGVALFGKQFVGLADDAAGEEGREGRLMLKFKDGSTAEADAIVGCDGINSRTRNVVLGKDHPALKAVYTGKYVYRGLIPIDDAAKAVGQEKAKNAQLWMGPDRHVLTFVVDHGKTLNLVAMASTDQPWPDEKHHVLPSTREKALEDFKAFGPGVNALIKLTKEHPDVWALYDLGNHHLPTYHRGRILLAGDAAHASTPHHGAGAGFGLEDCAILSSLLESPEVQSPADLEAVFAAFDASRRARCQWLIDSSRVAGDLYEWRAEGYGKDLDKIRTELEERTEKLWGFDVISAMQQAREDLERRLGQQ